MLALLCAFTVATPAMASEGDDESSTAPGVSHLTFGIAEPRSAIDR